MENKIVAKVTEAKEKLFNVTMQEGTMREEERDDDDEGGQQWGYSQARVACFFSFLRRAGVLGVHAVLVYLTRSFPVPSQKHGL